MKRFFGFLGKLLVFAASVAGCIYLYLYVIGHFADLPMVGYLQQDGAEGFLNLPRFEQAVTQQELLFSSIENSTDLVADAEKMLAEGADILVVAQTTVSDCRALVQAAQDADATLFFLGVCPSDAVLSLSDNVWYLGSTTAQGAELLGKKIAMSFREGEISDANADHILQYYSAAAPSGFATVLNHYTMDECEHYGVYSALLSYQDEAGAALAFDAELLAEQPQPELILCATEQDARTAHATAKALGWLDSETPVRLTAAVDTPEAAKALVEEGIVLAAAYTDPDSASDALASFLPNVLERQFVAQGTELVPDALGRFALPYQLAE